MMCDVELYPHQEKALGLLKPGKILCGPTGSGKSRAILAYFFSSICGGDLKNIEAGMPNERPLYIITTAQKRDLKEWENECFVFGIKPTVVDSWNNIAKYTDVRDAYFVFDEQRLVGYGAWVKAFLKIAKVNSWNLLSATPGDVWSDYIPVFIANGFYKHKTDFMRQHAVFDRFAKYPKIARWTGTGTLYARRAKVLVLMPYKGEKTKIEDRVFCEYDHDLYSKVVKDFWDPYEEKPIESVGKRFSLMRKVVNSNKDRFDKLVALLREYKRAIIFYNFDYELETLKTLTKFGYRVAEYNGHKHEPVPQSKTKPWVYLVQYNAGAEGWNCRSTDTVIFWSRSYSYRATVQAMGRIDRLDSPFETLHYVFLESDSSIDRGISDCYGRKEDFNESAFIE